MYVQDNSRDGAHVWAIGRRIIPDRELKCTPIFIAEQTELPVTNCKNFLNASEPMEHTYCCRYRSSLGSIPSASSSIFSTVLGEHSVLGRFHRDHLHQFLPRKAWAALVHLHS